jgi:hypothetical protein
MTRPAPLAALCGILLTATAGAADKTPDLLRLTNGELAGHFAGIDRDGVIGWERDDGIAPMQFRTDNVRQIILGGVDADRAAASTSHVELVNGDRLPATIVALDETNLTVESSAAGTLVIPRDAIRRLGPNPFGGRLIYAGPFDADEWRIDDGSDPEPGEDPADGEAETDQAEAAAKDAADEDAADEDKNDQETGKAPGWQHLGSRWYRVSGSDAITLEAGMPRRSLFRFHLEWRGRSMIAVGFHADFAPPPAPPEKEDGDEPAKPVVQRVISSSTRGLTGYFGRAMVLTLRGNYVNLYQTGYGADGEPFVKSLRASTRALPIDDANEADFELRTDLDEGFVSLFVDGEFSMQWQVDPFDADGGNLELPGGGIGFRCDDEKDPLRVSDIFVAEWNGMPDSARSMESADRDVVLLTNGTDRVSGTVTSIAAGRLTLEGPYAPLLIPIGEIAEVRFATDRLREMPENSEDRLRIRFKPIGRITGVPGVAKDGGIALRSDLLGELSVSLDHAAILEFRQGGNFLDAWDDDF